MTGSEISAIIPLIVLSISAIVVTLQVALYRNHYVSLILALVGLALSFVSLLRVPVVETMQVTALLQIDQYALFFMGVIFLVSFIVALLTYGYIQNRDETREEYYIVLLLATLGSAILVASSHFASLFLGLEILTVSLYVMIAYLRFSGPPLEAGIKYLILAAASSAFLLFGMALLYAELGTMHFNEIADALTQTGEYRQILVLAGTGLLLTGAGFKLAVVPFHMWTPDVYEGAPAPVTAFVATVSKGGMMALLLRYFLVTDGYSYYSVVVVLGIIAVASMFLGNLLALLQRNIKRLLAYSSIAHLGYILVAFLAGGERAIEAVAYYLVVYFITTLGAFGIISVLSEKGEEQLDLADYRGLFWRRPFLAAAMTAMMLSLAGIPLTAGFVGKFFILTAGVSEALWGLVVVLVINSAIGLYYYLRVVVSMLGAAEEEDSLPAVSVTGGFVIFGLTAALIYFGVYPAPLVELIRNMAATLI